VYWYVLWSETPSFIAEISHMRDLKDVNFGNQFAFAEMPQAPVFADNITTP